MELPLIGADPEVFLRDVKSGQIVSAAGFFPGTKKEPYEVDCGAVQVDGIAFEFNIKPAKSEDEFYKNISTVHMIMDDMVKKVNPDWEITHSPYAEIEKEIWDTVPKEAKELGCDPDYNYLGKVNPNPTTKITNWAKKTKKGALRTASGHIHIGWSKGERIDDPMHFEDARFVAAGFYNKQVFKASTHEELNRLQYYGYNGAFRCKPYGVELRSPSNLWLGPGKNLLENSIKGMYQKVMKNFHEITGA